ncbi:Oxidoreductase, partial [Operophtera brumata]
LTHICFGTVAFAAASISLCYGFDKIMFRNWVTPGLTPTVIAFTAALTAIVILNPLLVLVTKSRNIVRK